MKKIGVILLGLLFCGYVSVAQETESYESESSSFSESDGFNKYSVRPIHVSDIMYKKTLIRAVDLREKQNRPMFSKNREITRLLIDAVKRGDITPYANDSLDDGRQLTIDEFLERMTIPSETAELTAEEKEIALANGDSSVLLSGGTEYYFPTDLYQLEIKEDLIFDKQRSRMYYDIHALTVFVPADHPSNIKGIQLPVASFKYKELVEKLFTDNPIAVWYNPQNDAGHKALADAFELRLFSSYIIKVSNPTDAYLVDIYGGDQHKGIMASQWAAFELLEYEHNLWEF
ncbi:MAG TPA: gliding motility protein GldN [Cytophagaceae bacterium]